MCPGYEESSEGDTDEDVRNNAHAIRLGRNTALPVGALKEYILQHSSDSHFKDEFSVGSHPGNVHQFLVGSHPGHVHQFSVGSHLGHVHL